MSHGRYKFRDYTFGLFSLKLRERTGLSQAEIAYQVGVTEKAIRNWEGGASYPTGANLKKLIEIYLRNGAFIRGQEQEEARALWEQAGQNTTRRKASFDEGWFMSLLAASHPFAHTSIQSEVVLSGVRPSHDTSLLSPGDLSGLHAASTSTALQPHDIDWGGAIDVSSFCGRIDELAELEQWVLTDHCRVVALLGIGGMGKTALSIKLTQQLAPHFEYVIWRTVRNAPHIEELLADCIQVISEQAFTTLPASVEQRIALLIDLMRKHRCFLVLDNMETLLQGRTVEGGYREGYEEYGALIQRIAEMPHQSCLLLTSREMIHELAPLAGAHSPVRTLRVLGLDQQASQLMLRDSGLFGGQEVWKVLVQHYAGNPLALKIVAEAVRELFGGDIAAFLREGQITFKSIIMLLQQQFERLSPLEQEVMIWLAIESDLVSLEVLRNNLIRTVQKGALVQALSSLRRRCLVERGERGALFTLQPVVQEYVIEQLVSHVSEEIITGKADLLLRFALMKAQSKEYIRNSQVHLIAQPIIERLMDRLKGSHNVQEHLLRLCSALRELSRSEQGYGGGNIVNLLVHLRGDVNGFDFSHLAIWQSYLQGVEARDTNFTGADLKDSVFTENFSGIISVALSRDGKYLAAGGFDGTIRIWQVVDGKLMLTLRGHSSLVWSIAFSSDATMLASGGYDRTIRLWDVSSILEGEPYGPEGRCLKAMHGHNRWVRSVAFSPDSSLLATGDDGGIITIWHVREGACLRRVRGHAGPVWALSFSSTGLLASGGDDGLVKLWEPVRGRKSGEFEPQAGLVWSIAFSSDGSLLASGNKDGRIDLWDISSRVRLRTLLGHTNYASALAFGPYGLLASGSHDGQVKLWDVSSGRCIKTLQSETAWVWSVDFSANGVLASGSHDGTVKLWEVGENGERVHAIRTLYGCARVVCSVAFSSEGKTLFSGDDNGSILIWDVESESHLKTIQGHVGRVWTIACSQDGSLFASGGDDCLVKVWKRGDAGEGDVCIWTLRDHTGQIWSLAFSPDSRFLAAGGLDLSVNLWEVESGECIGMLRGHNSWIWSMAFSPDGHILASGEADGAILLWDVASKSCLRTLRDGNSPIGALAFSADGKTIASCNDEEAIKVWEVSTGRMLHSFEGRRQTSWVQAMAFSNDASLLALGDDEQIIKVRTIQNEQRQDNETAVRVMRNTSGHTWAVAFSPDKNILACGSDNGKIPLWDVCTGRYLKTLQIDGPYERMNISGATGITEAQRLSLKELGAIERPVLLASAASSASQERGPQSKGAAEKTGNEMR